MQKEHFNGLAEAIASAGSNQFVTSLMDAACQFAQLDHLALDVVQGAEKRKISEGVSVTSSVFARVVASSSTRRLAGDKENLRPASGRRISIRRLNLDIADLRCRDRDFYLRFGIVDGLELQWRGAQASFHLDLYRTHRLGRLSNAEASVLSDAVELFAKLVELHASLGQLALAAAGNQKEDVLQIVVGLLGDGLTPREKAVACRIAAGMGTEEIARDMGVMPATVVTFRKRAYAKLGIGSRAELFARCFQLLLTAEGRNLSAGGQALAIAGGLQRVV